MKLRDYQERAVARVDEALLEHRETLLVAPTGSGKTIMMAAIAAARARRVSHPLRVLVLQHRDELVAQNLTKFQKWNKGWPVARFVGDEKRWARPTGYEGAATFAMVPSLARNLHRMQPVDLVLFDECFVHGTLVGDRQIQDLRPGDLVPSYDEQTGLFVERRVVAFMASMPCAIVVVRFDGGMLVCTPGHPFLTRRGWVPAATLTAYDEVLSNEGYMSGLRPSCRGEDREPVHELPEGAQRCAAKDCGYDVLDVRRSVEAGRNDREREGAALSTPDDRQSVLRQVVLAAGEGAILPRGDDGSIAGSSRASRGSSRRANASTESDADTGRDGTCVGAARALSTNHPGRQWTRPNSASDDPSRSNGADDRTRDSDRDAQGFGVSDQLQGGLGRTESASGCGDRWGESSWEAQGARREEGRVPRFVRVDGVEVLERGSDGTFGGLCPDGLVYNLEVEGTHTYLVGHQGLVVHNCHHIRAASWQKVLEQCRTDNPELRVVGVTATPNRSDKRGLGKVFKHVADLITLSELIESGHLVPPVARVVEAQLADQIRGVRRTSTGDYNMEDVARLIDHEPITQAVIGQWRQYAADRQTVVFCATVDHAQHVARAFETAGVKAGVVWGQQAPADRAATLAALDRRDLQVVVNVFALTEGFDSQPVSCVVLLRPSSFESTVLQMIGRGLRVVDPELYPGVVKTDCEVLDFGASINNLGGLEQVLRLQGRESDGTPGPAAMKPCRKCRCAIPLRARECPLCGFVYPREDAVQLPIVSPDSLRLVQVDLLLKRSPFEWYEVHDRLKICSSYKVWALAFADTRGMWHAFGGRPDEKKPVHLASGLLAVALARGDDWMREHGDADRGGRNAHWIRLAPTSEQIAQLQRVKAPRQAYATRYTAQCWLTAKFARREIKKQFETIRHVLEEREIEAAARGEGEVHAQVG